MLRLNIGCGTDIQSGYDNIDVRSDLPNVIIADVRNLPYDDNTVDEIRAIDVYEHVSYRESKQMLTHWVSKLKPGGLLFIQTPSIIHLIEYYLKNQNNLNKVEDFIARLFGGQTYTENCHYTTGHPLLFEKYLRDAGINGRIDFKYDFGNRTNMQVRAIK